MSQLALDEKIRDVFAEFAVDKALVRKLGLSGDDRHVPSYVMDWIVTFKSKGDPSTQSLKFSVQDFIQKHLPAKGEKEKVKFRLSQGETVTLLDAISVEVRLGRDIQYVASIPSLDEKKAKISESLIRDNVALLQGSTWGAANIAYDATDDDGGIRITSFKPMQTGHISLEVFRQCRSAFTVEEWLDVLIRTMGYEPEQYSDGEKLWMICRLIPVVQNRVNMMELAPPGSGKSYVYNNISRHVWLTAAEISPAVLFYNRQSKTPGLLTRFDLLVLDEAQSIRFSNAAEIQAQLKGYLEQGVYARGDCQATAECGLMLLANIDLKENSGEWYHNGKPAFIPARPDYIRKLPEVFLESPLLDRFHGIIPGWKIPPFQTNQQADGYGLKADYFAEVCHALRNAADISQEVRAKLRLSGYKRDCTAVERLASGLAKLLLISPDHVRFEELVVRPATEMRRLIRTQLNAIDPEGYPPTLQFARVGSGAISPSGFGSIAQYDLLEILGEGGMARVYKALNRDTQEIVALKRVVAAGQANDAAIKREIDIYLRLQQFTCAHILTVKDIFREGDTYALVTEYADGGNLWELVNDGEETKPLDPQTTLEIILEIADGIAALHHNSIVHRDIKPHNVLRCDDAWKIGDFGISKFTNKPVTGYTFQGAHSQPWAPPEQIQGAQAHPSSDIYALGKLMLFLLRGRTDAKAHDADEEWRSLITDCVALDPDQRPEIDAVITRLNALAK